MEHPIEVQVLTIEQIAEMRDVLTRYRCEAAAAMYRTDAYERPYQAGRGEMYRLWNLFGQALKLLETFEGEHYLGERS